MTLPASGAISFSAVNIELGLSSTAQISLNDAAVRTLFGDASGAVAMSDAYGKSNTSVPGAPTSVSASATSCSAISVSFSAPGCTGHLTIDYYQVVCTSSGSYSATGSSSPISITGLSSSTSYTFKVRAHNSKGYSCYSSSTGTASTTAVRGCIVFNSGQRCYIWTVPAGVTSISVFGIAAGKNGSALSSYYFRCCCYPYTTYYGVAGGHGGSGGAAGYKNNVSVTPGQKLQVTAAAYGFVGVARQFPCGANPNVYNCWIQAAGEDGSFNASIFSGPNHSFCRSIAATFSKGGAQGCQTYYCSTGSPPSNTVLGGGGGGAAGYYYTNSCQYQSGGRACPAYYTYQSCPNGRYGGGGGGPRCTGGGGVGIYGQGCNGSYGGYGGSGGYNHCGRSGGSYGGGGAGQSGTYNNGNTGIGSGGAPALRIIWPGNTRYFPNTDTGA